MRAMVLAAGLGTRLRPLTDELPKPVVPVVHRPLAAFAMDALLAAGARSLVANVHHLPDLAERELRHAAARGGTAITVLREEEILGTGGGVRGAREHLLDGADPAIVMNGDILFAPDLARAIEVHVRAGAIATMVLRHDPRAREKGAVEMDPDGRVRRLLGRPEGARAFEPLLFTGVHVLAPRAFEDLPERGCIIRTSYRRWVDEGERVMGIVDDSPWWDLGTPTDYLDACLAVADGAFSSTLPAVHEDAEIEARAVVRRSVVGPRARVRAGVSIEDCVVWPGATVTADARHSIVTPRGVVRVLS